MLRRNTIKPGPRLTPLDAPRPQSIRVEPALRAPRRGVAKQLRLGQLAVSKTIAQREERYLLATISRARKHRVHQDCNFQATRIKSCKVWGRLGHDRV
jgi:hypothetical protein